jgi:hypothetical protein
VRGEPVRARRARGEQRPGGQRDKATGEGAHIRSLRADASSGARIPTKVALFTQITGCAADALSGTLRDVDLDGDIALHYGAG